MNDTLDKLILQKLDEISIQLKEMKEELHDGDKRMTEMQWRLEALAVNDAKQAEQVKTLEGKVSELEPVRKVVGNLQKLFYAGAALTFAVVLSFASYVWVQKVIGK